MAKELTEEEMLKEALKDPEIRKIWGALKDIVPEAAAECKEKRAHARSTDS
ncbi:MAG: hypothetical protein C5S48_02675 [Candidatus Methanogaster sp.]|nr:MAG: hypothetical protein C5S48_02675 [ANME-2 cluster archaeon]